MGTHPEETTTSRISRQELSTELRNLASVVLDHDVEPSVARELTAHVRNLRAMVNGTRRSRYYEPTLAGSPANSFVDYSPISGRSHPFAIPMAIEPASGPDGEPGVRARLRLSHVHEGPPHGVHGGIVAAIFDELLGHAQQVRGAQALTASLTVRYRSVTPIDEDLEVFAYVEPTKGRRWKGRASCAAGDVVTAEAEAIFVGVDLASMVPR